MKKSIFWIWVSLQLVYLVLILVSQIFAIEQVRYYDEFLVILIALFGFGLIYTEISQRGKSIKSKQSAVLIKSGKDIWADIQWEWIISIIGLCIILAAHIIYIVGSPQVYFSKDYAQYISQVPDILTIPYQVYYDTIKDSKKLDALGKQKIEDFYVATQWYSDDEESLQRLAFPLQAYSLEVKEQKNWNIQDSGFSTELAFYPDNRLQVQIIPNHSSLQGVTFGAYSTALGGQFDYVLTDDKSRVLWEGNSSSLDCENVDENEDAECIREPIRFQNPDILFKKDRVYTLTITARGDFRTKFSEEFGVRYGGYVDIFDITLDPSKSDKAQPNIINIERGISFTKGIIDMQSNNTLAIAQHTPFSKNWTLDISEELDNVVHTELNYDTNLWLISFGDKDIPEEITVTLSYQPWIIFRHTLIVFWIIWIVYTIGSWGVFFIPKKKPRCLAG
ncbi:MAG: hypothetical protein RJB24_560 [Candidatus Parcubacteria bacterium]